LRKTITLSAALPDRDGVDNAHLVLREPTAGEVLRHGDPVGYVVSRDGFAQAVIDRVAIDAYAGLLINSHHAEVVLKRGSMADALAIEEAIRDFFLKARSASSASPERSPSADSASSASTIAH
jgi:hypothetical protein